MSKSPGKTGPYRAVPDLSADADPATAMAVGFVTIATGKKPVFSFASGGGTSEATPLVAGLVAAAQAGMKTPFGFLNPALYKLAGTRALDDVLPLTAGTPSLDRGLHRAGHAEGLRHHDRPRRPGRPVLHQRPPRDREVTVKAKINIMIIPNGPWLHAPRPPVCPGGADLS